MKKLASLIAGAVMLGGLAVMGSTSPASAHPCVAQGNVHLSTPFVTAVVNADRTATFSINASVKSCTGISASGTVTGGCGASEGSGTISVGGHVAAFGFQTAASVIIDTSGPHKITGNVVVNTTSGDSCVTGADDFLVTATVA